MQKQDYFVKLIPPRATFPGDITPEERATMKRHSEYYGEQFRAGKVLIYGPVMAREVAFGIAVLQVESEAEARQVAEGDPSVTEGLNRVELSPMRVAAAQAKIVTDQDTNRRWEEKGDAGEGSSAGAIRCQPGCPDRAEPPDSCASGAGL
ncbi:MAG TPA: YciI family protein [Acidobacteriaceae bacterium]|nr:YciI family protein [Acidobacteriaceae bacterium]